MTSVPTPEGQQPQQQQQSTGFAPRRVYEGQAATSNGQGGGGAPTAAAPTMPTNPTILQRPKVKKEKITELTAATGKLAIEESLKLVCTYKLGS